MAVVTYKCDTCKREIDIVRNVKGLDTVGRCIITHGCRGKLYQVDVHPDYIRAQLPVDIVGVDNWQQRKVLYNHTQTIQRTSWTIQHNLGGYPQISVYVRWPSQDDPNRMQEISPTDITIIDEDTLVLSFDQPRAGFAQLVAQQTDPDLFRPYIRTEQQTTPPIQVSSSGEVTVGTRISSLGTHSVMSFKVVFHISGDTTYEQIYTVDDQPSNLSPWVDYDRVVVKGRIYTVRSFNIVVPQILDQAIINGTPVRISEVSIIGDANFQVPNKDDIVILLSNAPYEISDKDRDHYIDTADVDTTNTQKVMFYNSGNVFSEPGLVKTIYPPIVPV